MTYRQAMEILIESASRDIKGAGLGYRSTSEKHRHEVGRAIQKVWPKVYAFPLSESDALNLGISMYIEPEGGKDG